MPTIPSHGHEPRPIVRVLIITCSDSRTLETDVSGQLAESLLTAAGHVVVKRLVVRDEPIEIQTALRGAESIVEAIFVNGGTGLSTRDRTYDALDQLLEKRIDGFGELFRVLSYPEVGAATILSRATAGLFAGKLVFSVPGSTNAVKLALEKLVIPVLSHAVSEVGR